MELSQIQINMMFGSSPQSALNYINYLGADLEYDFVTNSIVSHVNGFRMANLARLDIAQDILNAFRQSKTNGTGEAGFIDDLTPILKNKGWWNTKEMVDPVTGEISDEIIDYGAGSSSRLKLIYENLTNTMIAIAHYTRMSKVTHLWPYWRYNAIDDERTREEHAKLRGKIFRFDDPIWQIICPPNGHRCRCSVDNLSEDDIKRGDLVVLQSQSIISDDGRRGVSFIDENGQYVEFFPDPGFDYNPAVSYFDVDLNHYQLELAQQYVNAELQGPQLAKMYNDALSGKTTEETINAAVLTDNDMKIFGLDNNIITLEQSTLHAQMQNKTLLPLENLTQLQTAIINSPLVINYRGAICFCEFDGTVWRMIGISKTGDIRVIANLTDEAFSMIAQDSTIIRGQL